MRKKNEKLIDAISALSLNVSKLNTELDSLHGENAELRAGIRVLLDFLADTCFSFTDDQIQKEKDFCEGLANIMSFGVKAE